MGNASQSHYVSEEIADASKIKILNAFRELPLAFIPNVGQVDSRVCYHVNCSDSRIFFTPEEAVFSFMERPLSASRKQCAHKIRNAFAEEEQVLQGFAIFLSFLGANSTIPEGLTEGTGMVSYFIGNDPDRWHAGLPTFDEIIYRDIWPDVDLVFKGKSGRIKYEFIIYPGSELSSIKLAYKGADNLSLDEQGNLLIQTPLGILIDERPASYQLIDGRQVPVESSFLLARDESGEDACSFSVGETYDPRYTLIIDPGLAYSTFLGGNGTDQGNGIAVDGLGNAYVAGDTDSTNFPVTPGAFQGTLLGTRNAFVSKINTNSSGVASLVYSTYLGGNGTDQGFGIAIDASGNAYVTGATSSTNFPVTPGAFQSSLSTPPDAFLSKINTTVSGAAALVYSTYLGGDGFDTGFGVAVDTAANAYVAGHTESDNFPVTAGAFQGTLKSPAGNAFVSRINTNATGAASLVYSTYLGGSVTDGAFGISLDPAANAYMTGGTASPDFPVTPGAFQNTLKSPAGNAFVSRLNTNLIGPASLIYSTYLGGSSADEGFGIAADGAANAYVTGATSSTDFPIKNAFQNTLKSPSGNVFVSRLNTNAAGPTSLVYSTYLGGSGEDTGFGIAVDFAANAYVAGSTTSFDFPVTPGAFQPMLKSSDGNAFVSRLDTDVAGLPSLVYSTFLGGNIIDQGFSVGIDTGSNAYVAGFTQSPDFPVTAMAFQTTLNGFQNAFVTKLGTTPPPAPATTKDCILVNKVYDQCFTEELVTSQVPVTSACPGVTIPPGSTVGCIPIPGSATCTFAGTVAVTPPLTPFFEEVLVLNSFDVSAPILVAGVTVCSPTLTLTGAARADLWVPPGTTVNCDILAFGDCTCSLLASPTGLPVVLACTGKICKEIQITAPVKLLVPTYGFCDVPACTFLPQPGFACPPEPLFPPQRPVPPAISKAFGTATIPVNSTTSLTFTITNPNPDINLTGVGFTDALPPGLVVATPNGFTGSCGGTVAAVPGSGSISLSGGTLAAGTSCTFSVNVTGIAGGIQNNVTSAVTSNEGGTGNTASSSLTVSTVVPPAISKAFGAESIMVNGTTTLTFTITNPNPTLTLTGVAFTDPLPAGLEVTFRPISPCSGTFTVSASGIISLTGGTVAAGSSCMFMIGVIGTSTGLQVNTTSAVTSTNGGTGNTATASIMVSGG